MPVTVLNVGYPLAPVLPNTAGGAEQVLAMLDSALVASGQGSLVLAPAGSTSCGTLLTIPLSDSQFSDRVRETAWQQYRGQIKRALATYPIDVVHLHGIDFLNYLPDPGVPVLVTLHLPPSWYPAEVFRLSRPDTHLVCVSTSQAAACPKGADVQVIRNGITLGNYRPASVKGNYVVALGRICPEKGFHLALDAATQAGIPLILAGTVFGYPAHQEYFRKEIEPRLHRMHRFMAAVGLHAKRELLAGARCLLVPSLVDETSSLVAMEAMACGTPVVAFRRGALNELIENRRTGFLVNSVAEMADAVERASQLVPRDCREFAETHFSDRRMTAEYIALYQQLAIPMRVAS